MCTWVLSHYTIYSVCVCLTYCVRNIWENTARLRVRTSVSKVACPHCWQTALRHRCTHTRTHTGFAANSMCLGHVPSTNEDFQQLLCFLLTLWCYQSLSLAHLHCQTQRVRRTDNFYQKSAEKKNQERKKERKTLSVDVISCNLTGRDEGRQK